MLSVVDSYYSNSVYFYRANFRGVVKRAIVELIIREQLRMGTLGAKKNPVFVSILRRYYFIFELQYYVESKYSIVQAL